MKQKIYLITNSQLKEGVETCIQNQEMVKTKFQLYHRNEDIGKEHKIESTLETVGMEDRNENSKQKK